MDKLQRLLYCAHNSCEYYSQAVSNADVIGGLAKFPVLTSEKLRDNTYSLLANEYAGKLTKTLYKHTFFAPNGDVQTIFASKQEKLAEYRNVWMLRTELFGVGVRDRAVQTHHSQIVTRKLVLTEDVLYLGSTMSVDDFGFVHMPSRYIEYISAFQPRWLYLPDYCLLLLAEHLNGTKLSLPSSIAYIETFGTLLSPDMQSALESKLGITIAFSYKTFDSTATAFRTTDGTLHYVERNYMFEFCDGYWLLTSLTNYAFPIIRYCMPPLFSTKVTGSHEQSNLQMPYTGELFEPLVYEKAQIAMTEALLKRITLRISNVFFDTVRRCELTADMTGMHLEIWTDNTSGDRAQDISEMLYDALEEYAWIRKSLYIKISRMQLHQEEKQD